MSYTSKYTGNEIDELLDKVKGGSASKVELWSGSLSTMKEIVTLPQSVEDFDYILVDAKYVIGDGLTRHLPATVLNVNEIKSVYGKNENFPGNGYFNFPNSSTRQQIQALYGFQSSTEFFIYSINASTDIKEFTVTSITGISFSATSPSENSAPTGNIISFMGTKAPNGYLVCDGAELEISKYAKLAAHFEEQFGTKNHFGGDGTTTFAVPDLRNEFLRGYHGNKDEQLSGEIGTHQDATEHSVISTLDGKIYYASPSSLANMDSLVGEREKSLGTGSGESFTASSSHSSYTSRPTNVAVLYCIKY
jgi:microcystin-dependent protein